MIQTIARTMESVMKYLYIIIRIHIQEISSAFVEIDLAENDVNLKFPRLKKKFYYSVYHLIIASISNLPKAILSKDCQMCPENSKLK